jgi:hypothetical protein
MVLLDGRNEVEPVANYLEGAAEALPPAVARLLRDSAQLLRYLHTQANPPKRSRGAPAGTWERWSNPNYLVAQSVERRVQAWKRTHGRVRIPDTLQDNYIDKELERWNKLPKPPSRDRVRELLRQPKSRRLPI